MELFGGNPGGGISQAIGDQHKIAQTGLIDAQTAMHQAELGELPLKRQKIQSEIMENLANAGKHAAEIGLKNQALQEAKALAAAMQKIASGEVDQESVDTTPSRMVGNLARSAIRAGAPNAGIDLLKISSTLSGHEASARRNEIDARAAENRERMSDFDEISRRVELIQALPLDQQVPAYNEMNRYFEKKRGEPVPWADMAWNPQTAETLKRAALTQKDKLTLQLKEEQEENRESDRRQRNELTRLHREAAAERERRRTERRVVEEKIGGKPIAAPQKKEIDIVRSIVKEDFPDALKSKDIQGFLEDVAFRAKELRQRNPGLSPSEAATEAYNKMKPELEAVGGFDVPILGKVGTKLEYKRGPGSKRAPLPFTDILRDSPEKREVGKWYDVNGRKLRAVKNDGRYEWEE